MSDCEMEFHDVSLASNKVYVKTEDVSLMPDRLSDALQLSGGNLAPAIGIPMLQKKQYVYRKMCEAEFEEIVTNRGLTLPTEPPPGVRYVDKKTKWLSETLDHSRKFSNKQISADTREVVAEFQLRRNAYHKHVRDAKLDVAGKKDGELIAHQMGAKKRAPRKNMYHTERIGVREDGKVNIGIKGKKNIEAFNKHVLYVKKIDPGGTMNGSIAKRWIRRNGISTLVTALGVVFDGVTLGLSLYEDGGHFGPATTLTVADIVGGAALGELIGAAIGSIIPGFGTFICSFIGALIGSLLARGIASLFLMHHHVAPGPGPAPLDVGPGSGPAALDVGSGSGPATLDVGPGSGPSALDVGPGSGPPTLDVGRGSGQAALDVGPGSGPPALDVGPGSGPPALDVEPGTGSPQKRPSAEPSNVRKAGHVSPWM
ncbi:uncharacterized protein [Oscarella lobularis]|uniref:uncharacterized protein n=1 Tax=Oscarella lobularis TaxID=121494 RepID=UPI0033143F03